MMGCRRIKGMIAASVYDDLSENESRELDSHLAKCPKCSAELEELSSLSGELSTALSEDAPLDRDMLPAIRARLNESKPPRALFPRRLVLVGGMCLVLLTLFVGEMGERGANVREITETRASSTEDASALQLALNEADILVDESGDFIRAYMNLREALNANPHAEKAGEVQMRKADLAFSHIRLYAQAYDDYALLARDYPELYRQSRKAKDRLNMLAEAKEVAYVSLELLDAAKRSADGDYASLEKVIVKYPGTFVASVAAGEMAQRVALELELSGNGSATFVDTLRTAQAKCSDPVAVAQLNIEIGLAFWNKSRDFTNASAALNEASKSGNERVARLAKATLAEIKSEL